MEREDQEEAQDVKMPRTAEARWFPKDSHSKAWPTSDEVLQADALTRPAGGFFHNSFFHQSGPLASNHELHHEPHHERGSGPERQATAVERSWERSEEKAL